VPGGWKSRITMTRSLRLVGVVVLVVAQPVVAFGAPPGGAGQYSHGGVVHPNAQAHGEGSNAGDPFKIIFGVNPGPRPLPESRAHSAFETSQRLDPQTTFYRLEPRGLGWIPAVFQSACHSANDFWGQSSPTGPIAAPTPPPKFKVGSLVDGHRSILSYAEDTTLPNSDVTPSNSSFQNGFQPAPCGGQLLQSF
jgi:hypothetical protein